MKTLILPSIAVLLSIITTSNAQSRRPDPPPEQAAKIEAIRNARFQRIRAERLTLREKAKEDGRAEARATIGHDQKFMAVWTNITPQVRAMANARELADRVSRRPEWQTQTRAKRIAAVTDFITSYPAIKAARPQLAMDTALEEPGAEFPGKPNKVALVSSLQLLVIDAFPEANAPDLFTINRQFNWNKPHGQWMNQMLKDIDAAAAAGDIKTYNDLTQRYSAWAEKYLRR